MPTTQEREIIPTKVLLNKSKGINNNYKFSVISNSNSHHRKNISTNIIK